MAKRRPNLLEGGALMEVYAGLELHPTVWRMEAALLRKKLQGGAHSLDKGLFMGAA
jgi:hypothetical protein